MPKIQNEQKYCEKCHKVMRIGEFYGSNNPAKYPDGHLNQCKKCITMHVDNWNPDTFKWILEESDVPYIPPEWNKLLAKYGEDPTKLTGTSIIGRYLSKMRLNQWNEYRFKDTDFLQQLADHELDEAMKRQGVEAADRTQTILDSKQIMANPNPDWVPPENNYSSPQNYYNPLDNGNDEIEDDLTDDDRKYLKLKWGNIYKPYEWVKLEQLYEEMRIAHDVKAPGDLNTLKLVCKASLKAEQLLDIGDVDGAQKMAKMYDSLMKSGKWTAAQNKKEQGEFLDSISELVSICETEGFIPRYYIEEPGDRVDETLIDMKNYTRSLVMNEMNLGNLIEGAIRQIALEENKQEDEDIEDEELTYSELGVDDYEEYNNFLEEEKDEDIEAIKKLMEGDDD